MLQTAPVHASEDLATGHREAPPLRVTGLAARSERGRLREVNEDGVLIAGNLLAVADGVGGGHAGEEAAAVTLTTLRRHVPALPADAADALLAAFAAANADVRGAAVRPERSGMAATLVAALLVGRHVTVAHAGDSRAYLLHDGALRRLTTDHSLVGVLEHQGLIDSSGARRHPLRSMIVRAVGLEDSVVPDVTSCPVSGGDVLLLCSDGLSDALDDRAIESALCRTECLDEALERLSAAAARLGPGDDVTIVAAVVG